jgi:hypothetical protein
VSSAAEKVKSANPFAKVADALVPAAPASPAAPAKPVAGPSGPTMQVDWADPSSGKRMSGTAAERDASMKKKAPATARSMRR